MTTPRVCRRPPEDGLVSAHHQGVGEVVDRTREIDVAHAVVIERRVVRSIGVQSVHLHPVVPAVVGTGSDDHDFVVGCDGDCCGPHVHVWSATRDLASAVAPEARVKDPLGGEQHDAVLLVVAGRRACHHDPVIGQQRNINRCTGPVHPLHDRGIRPRLNHDPGPVGTERRIQTAVGVKPGNQRIELGPVHPGTRNHHLPRRLHNDRRSLEPETGSGNGVPAIRVERRIKIAGRPSRGRKRGRRRSNKR